MSRYESVDCPICGKPLENGEAIAVCPECGAPYHRECYLTKGVCIFTDLHEKGEEWKAPRTVQETVDGNASLRCSRCGALNPPSGIFCEVCGNKLDDTPMDPEETQAPGWNGAPNFGGFPQGMPLNPYTTPFGGVSPDEEIDGIPAKELAVFVGRNSHYYLPHFKAISRTKARVLNWAAFFFQGGYFLYRKMYLPAVLLFLFSMLLAIPGALLMMQGVYGTEMLGFQIANETALNTANLLCSFGELALRFFCGFAANSMYKRHCEKKIRRIKAEYGQGENYMAILGKKGSVAIRLISILLIGYLVLNLVSLYLMLYLGY